MSEGDWKSEKLIRFGALRRDSLIHVFNTDGFEWFADEPFEISCRMSGCHDGKFAIAQCYKFDAITGTQPEGSANLSRDGYLSF